MQRHHLFGIVLGALLAPMPVMAQTDVWNFNGPQGALGTTATFISTPSGIPTVASGFGPGGAVNLFQKNAGAGEVGLGLTNDASGLDEITFGSFIQLSLPAGINIMGLSIGTGSSTTDFNGNPETWGIGLSNTSGVLGATVLQGNGNQTVTLSSNGNSFVDVTDLTSGPGNGILVTEMNEPTPGTPPVGGEIPEPGTLATIGTALLMLGSIRWLRKRHRS